MVARSPKTAWTALSALLLLAAPLAAHSAGQSRDDCFTPTLEGDFPLRFVWRLAGGGDLASSASYFPMCFARKEPPPGDPFDGPPLFFTPSASDSIEVFDRNKPGFGEPGEQPGPINGTITSAGGVYAGLGIIAMDAPAGRSDIRFSVGGVLNLSNGFSGFGFRDADGASNLRISGSAVTTPLAGLHGVDVQGSIAVSSERPTVGLALSATEVRIAAKVTAWDAFVGFGAGSTGTLQLQPEATLALTGSAQLMFVGFGGDGTLDVGANALLQSGGLLAGIQPGSRATISLHEGGRIEADLTPSARLEVGRMGTAVVTVGPGSEIQVATEVQIGSVATGDGFLRVDAGGKLSTETFGLRMGGLDQGLGPGGTGRLVVNGGDVALGGRALIGAAEGGQGTVEMTSGTMTLKERMVVGHAGEGEFKLSGDGKLSIATPLDGEGLRIGRWATGKGKVELSGLDAAVEGLGNRVIVGLLGDGTLEVNDGFLLDVPTADVILGQEAGAIGRIEVRDPFSELRAKNLTIGESGSGALEIRDGGKVAVSGLATLGETPPASGSSSEVIVAGEGSVFEAGRLEIGSDEGARSTVIVIDGGLIRITASSQPLTLGAEQGSYGRLVFDGSESRIETPEGAAKFVFGDRGEGIVEFRNEAVGELDALTLGKEATGKGTLLVEGEGSRATITSLVVGGQGEGLVEIADGAAARVREGVVIGQAPSGGGTLTQSGRIDVVGNAGPETSSRLAIGQNLTVGQRAIGLVKLADGGQVEVDGDLLVGAERNGVGRIEIEGQQAVEDPVPTVLKVGGAIALGRHGGQGVLVLKHGGQLSGPTLSPEKIELAAGADSVGRIELQDALLTSRDLVVGAGGEARVELKGASTLQSTGLVEIGGKAGSASGDGLVRISEDSRWLVTGAFQRGPLVIGNERPGDVVVSQHARLEAGAMRLGAADSARGALYVLDDAAIENKLRSGESVVVGYDSAGDNRVEFSGRSWTIAPVDGDAAELVIGRQGNGLVDVMKGKLSVGDASAANAPPENGLIRVGVDGRAQLRIRQSGLLPAGVVEASAIAIGANDDAEVLLEGGRLSARQVTLEGGRSALRIMAGGRASAGEVESKGTLVLQGDDARLNVLGAMTIQGPEAEFRVLEGGGVDAERLRLKDVAQTEIAGSADEGEGVSTRQLQVEGSRLQVNHGGRLAAGQAAIGGAGAAGRAQLAVQGGQVEVGDSLRVGFVQDFVSTVASSAPGELVVRGGGRVTVGKQLFVGPLGHVDIADGRVAVGGLWGLDVPLGELHVGTGGSLRGCARVRASRVVVRPGGVAEPGCSPGTLAVDGDFVVEAGGTLQIELAGLADGLHDLVDVLGNVTIGDGAQLDLRFLDGFAPQAGDVVDFLRATGDLSGNFAEVRVSGLAAGWDYRIGSTVDGLLRLTSLNDAQAAGIPEPATLASALVGLTVLTRGRRRRL